MQPYYEKKGFSWGALVIGILDIIVALIAFANPTADIYALSVMFGILAVVQGFFLIAYRGGTISRVIFGVIDILIGILLLLNLSVTSDIIVFLFPIWFIVDSISIFFTLNHSKALGTGYMVFSIIVAILGICVGIILFANPTTTILTIAFLMGFYFMMVGISSILYAFSKL